MNKNRKNKYDLKTIIEQANKGYIDDPNEVDEVMRDLLIMPLKRILDVDVDDYMVNFYGPIRESDVIGYIDNRMIYDMPFMDLLVVLNHIPKDRWTEIDDDTDGEGFKKRCLGILIIMMKNYRKYIPEFHRFMSITIGSFFEYVDRHQKNLNPRFKRDRYDILSFNCHRYLDKEISKDQTISVLFDLYFKMINKAWQPWISWESYSDKILKSYQIMDSLLLKHIRDANPKEMSLAYVEQKYEENDVYFDDDCIVWDNDLFDDDQPEENNENL